MRPPRLPVAALPGHWHPKLEPNSGDNILTRHLCDVSPVYQKKTGLVSINSE